MSDPGGVASREPLTAQPAPAAQVHAASPAAVAFAGVPGAGARLTPSQFLSLQRTVGNRAAGEALRRIGAPAGGPVLQRSPLSEQLAATWTDQGKEPFFVALGNVRESDPDVESFIERTLTGTDLRRARRIVGTDRPLSDVERAALATQLVSRLSSAETLYSAACQQTHERIRAEDAAAVELVTALVTIGITYVVPGLGGAITRLATPMTASASAGTARIALGIQSRAGAIASTIGEAGKRATAPVVRGALGRSPRDFLNALIEGFTVAKDHIVGDVTGKIQDRVALPDEDLWLAVANWDPAERTVSGYAGEITRLYERWETQVAPIGPLEHHRRSTIEQDEPYTTQVGVVWAQHASGEVLVQASVMNGRLSFSRFIDADLRDMALSKAATTQPRGIQSIPWGPPHIFGLPSTVPANAARR